MYVQETIHAGKTLEIRRYFTARYGKRIPRGEIKGKTSEAVARQNAKRQERELRWLLNENFQDGTDALVTLSWGKGTTPPETSEEMKKEVQKFFRRLRKKYRENGKELKYVYTMEIGPKGSRHIHVVLNEADNFELWTTWQGGVVDVQPLNSNGQYAKIASYFAKYSQKTEKTEGKKLGRRYNPSLNLRKPKITKKIIKAVRFCKEPKERKGYFIDKELSSSGVNEFTGLPYLFITYQKLRD
ncbi:hypothetical protein SAMN02745687_00938 [Lachnospiraceae bacterium NK3A20]|nr:hypothetical protein SAMN02745687_00938 [Lachnospiraceae bacterium NK3A20]